MRPRISIRGSVHRSVRRSDRNQLFSKSKNVGFSSCILAWARIQKRQNMTSLSLLMMRVNSNMVKYVKSWIGQNSSFRIELKRCAKNKFELTRSDRWKTMEFKKKLKNPKNRTKSDDCRFWCELIQYLLFVRKSQQDEREIGKISVSGPIVIYIVMYP